MHEETMAILKGLVSVAWADGTYAEKETEAMEAFLYAFHATEEEAQQIREYAKQRRTLDDIQLSDLSADDRRVLLQHAVLLTHIDGEQHEAEKACIAALCEKLRIPAEEATQHIAEAEERTKRHLNML